MPLPTNRQWSKTAPWMLGQDLVANGAILVGPGSGVVLVQTPELATDVNADTLWTGSYEFQIEGWGSLDVIFDIQRMESDGATVVWSQRHKTTMGEFTRKIRSDMAQDEILRIVLVNATSGDVQFSIFYRPIV